MLLWDRTIELTRQPTYSWMLVWDFLVLRQPAQSASVTDSTTMVDPGVRAWSGSCPKHPLFLMGLMMKPISRAVGQVADYSLKPLEGSLRGCCHLRAEHTHCKLHVWPCVGKVKQPTNSFSVTPCTRENAIGLFQLRAWKLRSSAIHNMSTKLGSCQNHVLHVNCLNNMCTKGRDVMFHHPA